MSPLKVRPMHAPLVAAAVLFVPGLLLARVFRLAAPVPLTGAIACLLLWLLLERRRPRQAFLPLGGALLLAGASLWSLNQHHLESNHLARWVPATGEVPVTAHVRVLVPPDAEGHRDRPWLGRVTAVLTTAGWRTATGDVTIRWRAPDVHMPLHRGDLVEVYAWAARPKVAQNPGAIDRRARLAADRVFLELRIPRPHGVIPLDRSTAAGPDLLTRGREWLRGKLLAHTLDEDVPAAYALTALLLGHRDPAIAEVSQSFADAGVAHLLAISGSHIVFFAWIAWGFLLLVPLRPRVRELVIALLVAAYVLATPCGPPIVRAAVALAMVVASRLSGRPGQYLNMLAAAVMVVVLIRPADVLDAGFQLSFVSTAGLILLAERVYHGLFGAWLERRTLIAELADTAWARRRLLAQKWICGAMVANLIGAVTAMPLVAMHFGQVNVWAVPAGLVALPVVSVAMIAAAVQLAAEVVGLGGVFAGGVVAIGKAMIAVVGWLAGLPGAAVAVRPIPWWVAVALYVALLVWIVRRRIGVSRAMALNGVLGAVALAGVWYTVTMPVGRLEVTVFQVGEASSVLMRLPNGELWAVDAGAVRGSVGTPVLAGALRLEGERRLDGVLLTALDTPHASAAGEVIDRFDVGQVMVSAPGWGRRGETLAGANVEAAAARGGAEVMELRAGDVVRVGGTRMEVLWPPAGGEDLGRVDLIVCVEYAGRRVLIADPRAERALAMALSGRRGIRCDAVIFTGVERGGADAGLRRTVQELGAQAVWSGRGPWAAREGVPGEWNVADGAVRVRVSDRGTEIGCAGG